jgi:hypothetical protein
MALASTATEVHQQRRGDDLSLPLPARQRLWDGLWRHLLTPSIGDDELDRPEGDSATSQSSLRPVAGTAEEE